VLLENGTNAAWGKREHFKLNSQLLKNPGRQLPRELKLARKHEIQTAYTLA